MIERKGLNTYEIFTGDDLRIAQSIQNLRLKILVHSYIYYDKDMNIVPGHAWNRWAQELVILQNAYPHIAEQIIYHDQFKDWDGASGAFFKFDDATIARANNLLGG